MIQIETQDGIPVFPGTFYMNTREAERAASRKLGKDWEKRGYATRPWRNHGQE